MERSERIKGALYGLLIGDALGVPYEFSDPADIPPDSDIHYTPPADFYRAHDGVPPGTWSDDGAQALCLLESLLEHDELNLIDFSQRLQSWYFDGKYALDGKVFDVGIQTRQAILKLADSVFPDQSGRAEESANGNGSLMRTLPLALWHCGSDAELVRDAHSQSIVTHAHPRAQACCALYCLWGRRILEAKDNPWISAAETLLDLYQNQPVFHKELIEYIRPFNQPSGQGTAYVIDCFNSARIACEESTFESTLLRSIRFGNDTDTTACVAGGIAGLTHGYSGIPAHLVEGLRGKDFVDVLLDKLK